jgi:hypothetical protein
VIARSAIRRLAVSRTPAVSACRARSARSTPQTSLPIPTPASGVGPKPPLRARCTKGVARDGSHLFPAFPYDHYTKVRDDDVHALYAFFMTRPPARAEAMPSTLPFPFNIRALQAGWKLLFFRGGVFEPDPTKGDDWNRGAYLAAGLGHCGACHTPRNGLAAEKTDAAFAGAMVTAGSRQH